MVVRRLGVRQFVDVTFERFFLLGRAPQLEPQMLQREAVGDRAAIVGRRRFGTRVARQRNEIALVDLLRDESARHRRHALRGGGRRGKHPRGSKNRQRTGERAEDCDHADLCFSCVPVHLPIPHA